MGLMQYFLNWIQGNGKAEGNSDETPALEGANRPDYSTLIEQAREEGRQQGIAEAEAIRDAEVARIRAIYVACSGLSGSLPPGFAEQLIAEGVPVEGLDERVLQAIKEGLFYSEVNHTRSVN